MNRSIHFLAGLLLMFSVCAVDWAQKPELVVQTGHSNNVYSVAFSPDGETLASGSDDGTIKLWDVETGKELRTFSGHYFPILSVAFSPDGKTLASGSSWEDKSIRLWDVETGKELRTLSGHSSSIYSVAFSPDGRTLASGSDDKTIKLWGVETGKELRTLAGHFDLIYSVAFSPDGKTLASGSWDKTIKLWDVESGKELRTLAGHSSVIRSVAFSPDGETLVSGSPDKTIKLWDVETGRELRTLTRYSSHITSVAFSPDGKALASGSDDKTIKLWDVETGRELRNLTGHSDGVESVAFSPDGRTLASVSDDKTIKLWEVGTGKELLTLTRHSSYINSVAFSPDGKTLATGREDKTIKLWDIVAGTELRTLSGHSSSVLSVAFSPDGKTLASGDWNLSKTLVGSWDQTIKLWNIETGKELRTLAGNFDLINSAAFSPDSTTLASGSADKTIKLWDVAAGTELRTLSGHSSDINSVAFSPNGKTLASGSKDGAIKLWDVAAGTELRTLSGHSNNVYSVTFSPDGKTLASISKDGALKLWDVGTGNELRTLSEHSIYSVAFSRDGKTLASGIDYTTIKLWDVASGSMRMSLNTNDPAAKQEIAKLFPKLFAKYYMGAVSDRLIVEVTENVKVKLSDKGSAGKTLATLIALDEQDWLVVTPDGLFDGSPAALSKIIWRFHNETFNYAPVEAFFREYWRPGLFQQITSGARPEPPNKDLSEVDIRQPRVRITSIDGQPAVEQALGEPAKLGNAVSDRNVEIIIESIDNAKAPSRSDHPPTSGAKDLRLFHNGSLVKLWQGDVFDKRSGCELVSTMPNEPRRAICKATVPIIAGSNSFSAYAFNHEDVKSTDARLTVIGADSLKRKGTLHILAAGVSQYANKAYNLNYTTDDAASLASQLKLQQEKLGRFETVNIKTLLNEEASKANMLAELKRLSTVVQPEDAVVVYFSGHGKADGDHFYLVPHDLGYSGPRDKLSPEGLQQVLKHSISDVELEEAFRDIDAGQMFMIIDACNSGQALENKDEPRRGPMNTRGLAQLAYEKGMYILTASQNVEEAFVSEKLKHSYLTYALVEDGLKTNAADADHNGEVTLREWFDYAVARVPKLREKTLLSKSLDQVGPTVKAARSQKSQTPRVFYRREPDAQPFIVATSHPSK